MIYYNGKAQGAGISAYDLAKAGGFSGTDAEFETSLANLSKIKITRVSSTLDKSKWTSDNHYSFETEYPYISYDLQVEINGDIATNDQIAAFSKAIMVGSDSSNIIKATGVKPTVDIPIIIEVIKK